MSNAQTPPPEPDALSLSTKDKLKPKPGDITPLEADVLPLRMKLPEGGANDTLTSSTPFPSAKTPLEADVLLPRMKLPEGGANDTLTSSTPSPSAKTFPSWQDALASPSSAQAAAVTRQDFLKQLWGKLTGVVSETLDQELNKLKAPFEGPRRYLRPPGAQANDTLFMTLCTRCDACTAACPHETISIHYGSGYPYDRTPILADLTAHPCKMCADLPCIAACPTEALQPLASIAAIQIGEARIDNTRCIAYQGQPCRLCYDACPLPETAIQLLENLPVVLSACTGCGLCQPACPTDSPSIEVFAV